MGIEQLARHDPDVVIVSASLEGPGAKELARLIKMTWGYKAAIILTGKEEGGREEEKMDVAEWRKRDDSGREDLWDGKLGEEEGKGEARADPRSVAANVPGQKDREEERVGQEKAKEGEGGLFDGWILRPFSGSSLLDVVLKALAPRWREIISPPPLISSTFPPASEAAASPLHLLSPHTTTLHSRTSATIHTSTASLVIKPRVGLIPSTASPDSTIHPSQEGSSGIAGPTTSLTPSSPFSSILKQPPCPPFPPSLPPSTYTSPSTNPPTPDSCPQPTLRPIHHPVADREIVDAAQRTPEALQEINLFLSGKSKGKSFYDVAAMSRLYLSSHAGFLFH